jgi:2-methylcitrate dehydratase PrpD
MMIAERLGNWASAQRYEAVPPAAVERAQRAIVDVVGVAFAGSRASVAATVRSNAARVFRDGACTVIGAGHGLAAPGAALVNAVAAHALDYDANFTIGMVFTPAVIFPAIFAAAEQTGASGADLITAFAIGAEIACTLGDALSDQPYRKDRDGLFYKGWFNSAALGPIAAAAACASILKLDASRTTHAVAIAAIQAGGLRIAVGSDMKPYLCGRAAEIGLRAALLAESGVSAPLDTFEGPRGFIAVVNDGRWTEEVFARLGQWSDPGTSFKLYPACSSIQAATEAFEHLLHHERIDRAMVSHVRCEVTRHIASNLAFPKPENVTQAQFSMPFAIGCVLAHGRFEADLLAPATLGDATVQDAMAKVEMRLSPDLDTEEILRDGPEATRVTITTRDGRSASHLQMAATGKPNNPMSDALLHRKFERNLAPFLSLARARTLLETLRSLASMADVRLLFAADDWPVAARKAKS